ncbi:hypothetical protein HDV06_002527 [Boothiomyces sp. JEL0866]|nr:hypothetical protein HDV06_002527 [Boothiomyces sp. JEL0866]
MLSLLYTGAFAAATQKANIAGRVITVRNNCTAPVSMNFISGASGYQPGLGQCNSDGDCLDGSSCNLQNHICFYKPPLMSTSQWVSPGNSSVLTFPYYNNNGPVWTGNIAGCSGQTCDQNGVSLGPQTGKAEFALIRNNVDFYDLTLIDGFSIPMEIAPKVAKGVLTQDPYFCTNPGSPSPTNSQLGACKWNMKPPTPYQVWVSGDRNSPTCVTDTDCQKGFKCGIPSQTPGFDPSNDLHCGKVLGYWSPEKACGNNQCNAVYGGNSLSQLFGCTNGIQSCYQQNSAANCCGCSNWNDIGIKVPSTTTKCANANPNWTSYVLPYLKWIKQTCPTAYVYPYDDMSSTFVCGVYQQGVDPYHPNDSTNNVEYKITFCPGNSKIAH